MLSQKAVRPFFTSTTVIMGEKNLDLLYQTKTFHLDILQPTIFNILAQKEEDNRTHKNEAGKMLHCNRKFQLKHPVKRDLN